jgi:ligand-binding SRPBCC domain-containing protein
MPFIHLTTFIAAPLERVFDLSRHVSVHKHSMKKYREKVLHTVSTGLLELNDEVKWQARHLFKERELKVKISALKRSEYFKDEQVAGDFKMMKHEHYFKPVQNGTLMIDQFYFDVPFGIIGRLLNKYYLENYMRRLLCERNAVIKQIAESNQWKQYLNT